MPEEKERRLLSLCEWAALEEFLADYPDDMTFAEVLEALNSPEHRRYAEVYVADIFENEDTRVVANMISDMRRSFIDVVTLALTIERQQ
jgi:hypothetical protein